MIINWSTWMGVIFENRTLIETWRILNTPIWNEHFGERTWPRFLTLYSLVVGFVCPKPDLQVMWDIMTTNIPRLTFQKSFRSKLRGTRVNSMTKYKGLQQVWQSIRHTKCTEAVSLKKHLTYLLPGLVLFTNPSARAGYDTRSIFKRSLTGFNSELSFS